MAMAAGGRHLWDGFKVPALSAGTQTTIGLTAIFEVRMSHNGSIFITGGAG
jgi:hypothetical protein